MIATIPMAGDVAELIGPAAERVENRSLLLDKFVFHKRWPETEDERGPVKWDEATRWSFIRIADGASQILSREAQEKKRRAGGRDVEPHNRERYEAEAKLAESLAAVKWDNRELAALRASHTRRFIALFRSAHGARCRVAIGQLEGRLAINLADSLIQNAGICLDRLFGLPFIPGSAVKGVCRSAALAELKQADDATRQAVFDRFRAVFGTADNDFSNGELKPFRALLKGRPEDQKGAVSFLPAYPLNEARIVVDLTNVHYPDYYRSGRPEDQAREKPQPNPFPTIETGAQFAFCLVLNAVDNDPALLEAAGRWLGEALTVRGLGAKTASGYGWFSLRPEVLEEMEAEERRQAEAAAAAARAAGEKAAAAAAEQQRLASLTPDQLAAEEIASLGEEAFAAFAKELAAKTPEQQRAFIGLLAAARKDRWKTWKRRKPDLAQGIEAVRASLNLPPLP